MAATTVYVRHPDGMFESFDPARLRDEIAAEAESGQAYSCQTCRAGWDDLILVDAETGEPLKPKRTLRSALPKSAKRSK